MHFVLLGLTTSFSVKIKLQFKLKILYDTDLEKNANAMRLNVFVFILPSIIFFVDATNAICSSKIALVNFELNIIYTDCIVKYKSYGFETLISSFFI